MAKKPTSLPTLSSLLVFYILCIAVIMIWFGLRSTQTKNSALSQINMPTPTPTPIKLPVGKGTYTVSQGKHDGPTISQVSFDPLDVHNGQTLTITLHVVNTTPIQAINGSLVMDNSTKQLAFTRTNTTGTFELWTTTVPIEDTLWYKYTLHITAQGTNGVSNLTVTPR